MEDDFNVDAAVDEIGSGLGIDLPAGDDDGLTLEVEAKVVPEAKELPAPTAGTGVAAETPADPAAAPSTETPVDAPPRTWRAEASATWAALPAAAKAEILKREGDIFKGIEAYKVDATFGKSMKTVVAPYETIMRANGRTPEDAVSGMLQAHHTLGTGTPEQKLAMLQSIAKSYRIDLTPAAPAGEPPYVDPTVAALQKELAEVKSFQSSIQARERQAVVASISSDVDKFAADPANTYFAEVANDVATLIEKGVATSLKDAYEKAIWANPVTRAKELARTTAETATKAAGDAAAKVAAAKKATGANVQTRAKSGSATTPTGSLDDTLSNALADIRSRA